MVTIKQRYVGGGKLNRTETVTLRLDPRLRYLTDLAARAQRRTTSGFIEWAIERSLREVVLSQDSTGISSDEVTLADESISLWDVDEPDRFAILAFNHPHLLTHEEQVLWKTIRENGYVWKRKKSSSNKEPVWKIEQKSLILGRLRDHWETFKAVAQGREDKNSLPSITKNIGLDDGRTL